MLTFDSLRAANRMRLPTFRNGKGERYHNDDGSDWSLNDWLTATAGELGELANLLKKVRRGDLTLEEARAEIGKEIADVQIYLDLLAFRAGVDLGGATVNKFNEVSERVNSPIRFVFEGYDFLPVDMSKNEPTTG